jgi:hypothetical protein
MPESALDQLLSYGLRVQGRDRSWMEEGSCQGHRLVRYKLFTCDEHDEITIAGTQISGLEAQRLAEAICFNCPVQWECARWALDVEEEAGVWSMTMRDMRWLRRRAHPRAIVDQAKANGEPVQVIVRRLRGLPGRPRLPEVAVALGLAEV